MKVVQEWLKSRSLMIKDGGGEGNGEKEYMPQPINKNYLDVK